VKERTRTWLHRIGYVCTIIVLAELLAVVGLTAWAWREQHLSDVARMHETQTQEGPLAGRDILERSAMGPMNLLMPRTALRGEGVRFVAMPQLSPTWYAVELAGAGQGPVPVTVIVIHRNPHDDGFVPVTMPFAVSRETYAKLTAALDRLTDGYAGHAWDMCLDGTVVAFERVRGSRITSGIGNIYCGGTHYGEISALFLPVVCDHAGLENPPKDIGWYPPEPPRQP